MSWHGVLHEVGFALSFMGAIAACGVFARRYAALGRRGWAVAAVATVVAVLVIAGWPDLNTLSVRLVTATAALFGFLSVVAAQLFHQACRRCIGWLLPASAFGRSARPGCRWSSRSQGASSASPQLECAQTRRRHGEPASARKGEILRAAMAATHKSGAL